MFLFHAKEQSLQSAQRVFVFYASLAEEQGRKCFIFFVSRKGAKFAKCAKGFCFSRKARRGARAQRLYFFVSRKEAKGQSAQRVFVFHAKLAEEQGRKGYIFLFHAKEQSLQSAQRFFLIDVCKLPTANCKLLTILPRQAIHAHAPHHNYYFFSYLLLPAW
jgi:hypothetical protein